MKLQLILDGQEVELNEKVSIPLNKTFENSENPMDIVVDYSKSINIPMTSTNNNILANSYRLDRTIISGDETTNLGIYLDPTKKIPMKLLFNSSVVLDGYAKFVSANRSTKNQYYTLNLFGVVGDIFQKLKSVVLSESQLTDEQRAEEDGGAKYILHDRCLDGSDGLRYLNAAYVWESWNNVYNNIYGYHYNPETGMTGGSIGSIDVIGFAPSYRGFYNDYESNQIQIYDGNDVEDEEKFMGVDEFLTERWVETYLNQNPSATIDTAKEYAEALGASDVVGDGIKDYQMREYRSYYMKPYLYFNQLLQMFQDHIKWHTDYKLELDANWFNVNNPYWTRMCYMLDFIDSKDSNQDTTEQITSAEKIPFNNSGTGDATGYITNSLSSDLTNDYIISSNSIITQPTNLYMTVGGVAPQAGVFGWGRAEMTIAKSTYFVISVQALSRQTGIRSTRNFYASFEPYKTASQYITETDLSEVNFIQLQKGEMGQRYLNWEEYEETGDPSSLTLIYYYDVKFSLPSISLDYGTTNANGIVLTRSVKMRNARTPNLITTKFYNVLGGQATFNNTATTITEYKDYCFNTSIDSMSIIRRWRDFIPVTLENIYNKEDSPLFDIVLQYTKMFGLMWVPDYNTKTIKLMHKNTFFKNYSIEDWSGKVDRTKDFIVEPITFGTRYIAFNYDDVDGYRYSGYRDKYGVNYGHKTISTGYDFGYETKDLFKGISPSSASSKSYIDFYQWEGWDLKNKISPITAPTAFADSEDEDEGSAISIYNWYLRGSNKNTDSSVIISDDSSLMKIRNEYCWMHPAIALDYGIQTQSIPTFNIAIDEPNLFPNLTGRVLACVFNTPKEDFTSTNLPSSTIGNAIYDLFWDRYIDERYNVQNKKVTAYFNLSSSDYMNFDFNKFILLDNQLFIVNKIFDFDLNTNGLTKVELIQVTDINTYKQSSETFPQAVISPTEVNIVGSNMSNDYDNIYLISQVTAFDESGDLTRGSWSRLNGNLTVYRGTLVDEDDIMDNPDLATENFVYLEYGDWESNIGRDTMILYWQDMDGSKFEGYVTYTVDDQEFEIPITIDYTV